MKKILVIDDEWKIRKLIKDYLVREGYIVDEAGDGEEGIEKFFSNIYDIVILDIMMPKIDGWSVCRKIREESQVPIIMLTARADESDQLFGFDLETDEYMVKPFDRSTLMTKVKGLFRLIDLNEELESQYRAVKEKNLQLELRSQTYILFLS